MMYFGKRFEYDRSYKNEPLRFGAIKLFQIGELCCEPTFNINAHSQWCLEISYIISGKATFNFNGEAMAVKDGDLIFSPRYGIHSITAASDNQLHFAYLGFNFFSDVSDDYKLLINYFENAKPCVIKKCDQIYPLFKRCLSEFSQQSPSGTIMIESLLNEIIVSAYRMFSGSDSGRDCEYKISNQNTGPLVYKVIMYVDKNIYNKVTIEQLAQELGYSIYYLSHVFKQKTGTSIARYISEQKISKAAELLQLYSYTVTQIAEQLSYDSVQSFTRSFKRVTGLTPTAWRLNDNRQNTETEHDSNF